jgi:hypothetical protein
MENSFAKLVTYAAHLVDGNVITDKLSIGGKTPLTGSNPPAPASVAGLDTHAVFEGDASMTRGQLRKLCNHSIATISFNTQRMPFLVTTIASTRRYLMK